jgi:hypothetical protein
MAEHVSEASFKDQKDLVATMAVYGDYSILCKLLGSTLQQLGDSVQQHLQQGQLPAALTVRAVEACHALCLVLTSLCSWFVSGKHHAKSEDQHLRQLCIEVEAREGAMHAVLLLVKQPALPVSV